MEIKMTKWISWPEKADNTEKNEEGQVEKCYLMGILSVTREQLTIIANFIFPQSTQEALAFISETITINNLPYRIIYIPPNKAQTDSVQHLTEIVRELSDIVIRDASSGLSSMRQKKQLENKQFVMVNGNQLYEIGVGKQSIELVRPVKKDFFQHVEQSELGEPRKEAVKLDGVRRAVDKYQKEWALLRDKEESLSQLSRSTLIYYQAQRWLKDHSNKFKALTADNSMLSRVQLQLLYQQIINNISTFHTSTLKTVAKDILQEVRSLNQSQYLVFIRSLQEKMLNKGLSSFQDLNGYKEQIKDTLKLYDIDEEYVDYVLFHSERVILKRQIQQLHAGKLDLERNLQNCQHTIAQKNNQLGQYKLQLGLYSDKVVTLINLEKNLDLKDEQISKLTVVNTNLKSQLDASLSKFNTLQSQNSELTIKVEHLTKQNKDLLECLQQFTKEHLNLHSQIQLLKGQAYELKDQVIRAGQIEVRALRSIENQAEIKTRLTRYEVYVKELKTAIQSFKKLETQKINFILKHNHTQHQKLKEQYSQLEIQLQRETTKNKELATTLQEQKVRMSYYQRFIMNNYPNQPIPECSEDNSASNTTRQQIKNSQNVHVL